MQFCTTVTFAFGDSSFNVSYPLHPPDDVVSGFHPLPPPDLKWAFQILRAAGAENWGGEGPPGHPLHRAILCWDLEYLDKTKYEIGLFEYLGSSILSNLKLLRLRSQHHPF